MKDSKKNKEKDEIRNKTKKTQKHFQPLCQTATIVSLSIFCRFKTKTYKKYKYIKK